MLPSVSWTLFSLRIFLTTLLWKAAFSDLHAKYSEFIFLSELIVCWLNEPVIGSGRGLAAFHLSIFKLNNSFSWGVNESSFNLIEPLLSFTISFPISSSPES